MPAKAAPAARPEGDAAAFREVFDLYYPKVLTFMAAYARTRGDAEDLAQEGGVDRSAFGPARRCGDARHWQPRRVNPNVRYAVA